MNYLCFVFFACITQGIQLAYISRWCSNLQQSFIIKWEKEKILFYGFTEGAVQLRVGIFSAFIFSSSLKKAGQCLQTNLRKCRLGKYGYLSCPLQLFSISSMRDAKGILYVLFNKIYWQTFAFYCLILLFALAALFPLTDITSLGQS